MAPQKKQILMVLIVLFLVTGIVGLYLILKQDTKQELKSFSDCMSAGFEVTGNNPRVCVDNEGNVYIDEESGIEQDNRDLYRGNGTDEEVDYYGTSTHFSCQTVSDCVTDGCNNEICRSIEEESISSICIFPDEPLPPEKGYTCGCFQNQCKWGK